MEVDKGVLFLKGHNYMYIYTQGLPDTFSEGVWSPGPVSGGFGSGTSLSKS